MIEQARIDAYNESEQITGSQRWVGKGGAAEGVVVPVLTAERIISAVASRRGAIYYDPTAAAGWRAY
jgi:hypothetical protein